MSALLPFYKAAMRARLPRLYRTAAFRVSWLLAPALLY